MILIFWRAATYGAMIYTGLLEQSSIKEVFDRVWYMVTVKLNINLASHAWADISQANGFIGKLFIYVNTLIDRS